MPDPDLDRPPTISFPSGPPDFRRYGDFKNYERDLARYEAKLGACARAGGSRPPIAEADNDPGRPDGPGPAPLPIVVLYAVPAWKDRPRLRVVLELGCVPRLERCTTDLLGADAWERVKNDPMICEILAESVMRTLEVLDDRAPNGHVLGGPRDRVVGPAGQPLITIDLGQLPGGDD